MGYLILVRHGESRWNKLNKFTGWVDVPLSEEGIKESLACGKKLQDLKLNIAFTSKLKRAQETLLLILSKQKHTGIFMHQKGKEKKWNLSKKKFNDYEIPIYSDNALNERCYGKLQGLNKQKVKEKYGEEKFLLWRRSYNISPPGGESLKDTVKRSLPYFKKRIMPHVKNGENVIVSAHGNSLRGIIKHIEHISDKNIPNLEIPTGKMIIYKYEKSKLVKKEHI